MLHILDAVKQMSMTSHLDGFERGRVALGKGLQHVLAGDAKAAQAVQDGAVEAGQRCKFGVDVQRVVVAVQAVQRRQVLAYALLCYLIRMPSA